jgi:cytochrome P450
LNRSVAVAVHYDPYDYEIDRDPHPVWRWLRDEAPLYYNEQYDFYALSRYDDVHEALLDWHTYSSARGTVLEIIATEGELRSVQTDHLGSMIFSDPPGHDVARHVVNRSFTPKKVGHLEQRIRELVGERMDALAGSGGFDFLGDLCARVPPMIIGELLGVPAEDQEEVGHWADDMMFFDASLPPEAGIGMTQSNPRRIHGMTELNRYLHRLIEQRRADPQDDMLSHLLAAEVETPDGVRHMDASELLSFTVLLQAAGSETTARLLGWTGVLLARHPDQRALLVEDPSRISNAVEELLRYEAPSPIQARLVTKDVQWHGQTVPAMSRIALLNASAGRDERAFPDPDRFDVTRHIDRHLAFGYGTHFCLGAALARLEGRVVLDEVLRRLPEWDCDEDAVEFVHTTTVRGPAKVPITF